MKPTFFASPSEFRAWLENHHTTARELLVGFYKKSSGKQSITWPESVEHALCFGWIDGVRKRIDEISYTIRFTPRKPTSTWSGVNIKLAGKLKRLGLMTPAGLEAFNQRSQKRSRTYSYEQRHHHLDAEYERLFKANKKAWDFYQGQAPWYRRTSSHWIMSAKKEETRLRRLGILMRDSEQGLRIAMLTPPGKR